jgi:hypothetical protein
MTTVCALILVVLGKVFFNLHVTLSIFNVLLAYILGVTPVALIVLADHHLNLWPPIRRIGIDRHQCSRQRVL